MKKIIFMLALVPALLLASCNNTRGGDIDLGPVHPGRLIYAYAADQNNIYAMLPAEFGFRLNVLLCEAVTQEIPTTSVEDLTKMEVKVNGKNHNFFHMLFSTSATLTSIEDGLYTISYLDEEGVYDGVITVNTGDKLLEEEGSSWSIELSRGRKHDYFAITVAAGLDSDIITIEDAGGCTITRGEEEGRWDIAFSGFKSISKNHRGTSDWSGSFTLMQVSGLPVFDLKGMRDALFHCYGAASGKTLYRIDMAYEIPESDPLEIGSSCDTQYTGSYIVMTESGVENAEFTDPKQVSSDYYPSLKASHRWGKGTNCVPSRTIYYNGEEGSFRF